MFPFGTTVIRKRRVFGRLATEDRGVELAVPITGGSNNPNPSLRSVPGMTTSDSILTLPVDDSTSSPNFRGDEEGGGGSRTIVTGPSGSLFPIWPALPDGSSAED